jgi:integrase
MKMRLPNGCSYSQPSIKPQNWQTKKAKVSETWFIKYRFFDPRYKAPKQVMIKGMNRFKVLAEKQAETQRLLDTELKALQNGYNPFEKNALYSHTDALTFLQAMRISIDKMNISEFTKRDLMISLTAFKKSINSLGWGQLLLTEVSRKHIRHILDISSVSDDRFNKHRAYIMMMMSVLCEMEMIPTNFVRDIKKRKVVKKIRLVLDDDERKRVNEYLKLNYPSFHRFLHIFFHSGARITELLSLRVADVDLHKRRFKVIIKKGIAYKEVWRVIKDIAMPYWAEVLHNSNEADFVFSVGLKPGKNKIRAFQITNRWSRLVKKKLNIKADFYSLKHLHSTEVSEMIGEKEAAQHNGHTSTAMVSQVYDVRRVERKNKTISSLDNKFA